jgi:RNA polymerase sigma-70 factor (ECF subfamily)
VAQRPEIRRSIRRSIRGDAASPATHGAADEAALLALARAGDREAFDRLAVRLLPRLLGTAQRLLGDPLEAEEVVAQTLVRAHRAIAGFRAASALSTWAHRILCRLAADRIRALSRQRRRERPLPPDEAGVPPAATMASRLDEGERRELLRAAVERLPEAQRLAVVLVAWEGLELAEAARLLDVRYATLKSNLHHARAALRAALGPALLGDEEAPR